MAIFFVRVPERNSPERTSLHQEIVSEALRRPTTLATRRQRVKGSPDRSGEFTGS
jgi:hypothetical protein